MKKQPTKKTRKGTLAPDTPAAVTNTRHVNTVAGLAANPNTEPTPAEAVPVIVPKEYEVHDPKLKHPQLAFAIELGTKYPGIVSAAIAFRESMGQAELALGVAGDRYRGVATELRTAQLNGREASLLLRGLGFAANRIHELQKVASLPDEQWQKYLTGKIGFKAAFALRNGEPPTPPPTPPPTAETAPAETATETDNQTTAGGNSPVPSSSTIRDCPAVVKEFLLDFLNNWANPCKNNAKTEYAFGARIKGTSFYVAITASPLNK